MHVMCMILASSESVFHENCYALTNTFPVMKQLGIKQGKVMVQYYFKFGSNILTIKAVSQPKSRKRPR